MKFINQHYKAQTTKHTLQKTHYKAQTTNQNYKKMVIIHSVQIKAFRTKLACLHKGFIEYDICNEIQWFIIRYFMDDLISLLHEIEYPLQLHFRWLFYNNMGHPVAKLFKKQVLDCEKDFRLYRTYSEGLVLQHDSYEDFDSIAKYDYRYRNGVTEVNRSLGLHSEWKWYMAEDDSLEDHWTKRNLDKDRTYRGNPIELWWVRQLEPFYIMSSRKIFSAYFNGIPYGMENHAIMNIMCPMRN